MTHTSFVLACAASGLGAALLLASCGNREDRHGSAPDAAIVRSDGAGIDGREPPPDTDASTPPGDAGDLHVDCSSSDGPLVVVVRPPDGSTARATTLVRLPLELSGRATGIELLGVSERTADGAELRAWPASAFAPPAGFDGTAVPREGHPSPVVLFSGTAPAVDDELAMCERHAWERDGALVVRLRAVELGDVEIECHLGTPIIGAGYPLRWQCPTGVAGWTGESASTSVADTTTPVIAAVGNSDITVHAIGAAPVTDIVATGATLVAHQESNFGATCPDTTVELGGPNHVLWRGASSEDVWNGPVAPGTEEAAFWAWYELGASLPEGVCQVPEVGPPPTMPPDCRGPVLMLELRGTSAAGAWSWESSLFNCYEAI